MPLISTCSFPEPATFGPLIATFRAQALEIEVRYEEASRQPWSPEVWAIREKSIQRIATSMVLRPSRRCSCLICRLSSLTWLAATTARNGGYSTHAILRTPGSLPRIACGKKVTATICLAILF